MTHVSRPETWDKSARPVAETNYRRARISRAQREEWGWAFLFILPTMIGLGVFSLWPIFETFYYSFTTWGAFGGHKWSGLKNYDLVLRDAELLQSTINTLVFTGLSLIGVPIAIVVAALLNRPGLRGLTLYRTVYFLPVVTLPSAVALMWKLLYSGDYGLVNWLLSLVGIDGPYWLSDPNTALYAVGIVSIWSSVGYNMVILLAGMQTVPREYYEAAEIDGAGGIRQFFSITIPLLTPSIFFVCVITVINALQAFDLVFLMVNVNNPALPWTQTVVYLFFEKGFIEHNGGYAAAIAFLLMIVILALTAIQFRLQRRWVHYG
ncbi:sugar ABC transporter permease [Rhizobium sp. BK251]|uniref:carbohydrate ABC transporter permease n=1 Tax=Rhizobium sp. BK251 TaxID=2512125 RepID=UPI001050469A|nr:sugar ABC transporter permease [Rhizobium sp. BK251]TCL64073.1 carbohydrate ABC transporter membrane protein 1 (CUT1 family) [Rhizobium sp. BK251]